MEGYFTKRQAANAADISLFQLDQWVSRGYVSPERSPEPGKARQYTISDIMIIATLADLVRLGINPTTSGPWLSQVLQHLHGFKDDHAVLVVWQGPGELIPCSNPGEPGTKVLRTPGGWSRINPGAAKFYDPDRPPFQSDIVRPGELPEMLRDPDKRSFFMVNLNHVEERVQKALSDDSVRSE